MKHSLDLMIVCNDKTTLDAITNALPSADDSRVWAEQYQAPVQSVDENGNAVLSGMVRFHEDIDRTDIEDAVQSVGGMFSLCEPGSYLRLHDCYHDTTPPKSCEVTTLYEVVAI